MRASFSGLSCMHRLSFTAETLVLSSDRPAPVTQCRENERGKDTNHNIGSIGVGSEVEEADNDG